MFLRRHHTLFTDQIGAHILELPKFNKEIDQLTTPLDRWLYFLRHGEDLDAEAVPVTLDVPELRWALGDLHMISRTDPDRELYEARLRERRDQVTAREAALAAQQTAREMGLAEGRAEARRADIQSLQTSLGRDVTPLEELLALTWEQLDDIWAQLQSDLRATLNNR